MSIFRKLDHGYSKLLTLANGFTAFMVFVLMLLITTDVVSRTAFSHPFQGISEIVSNCIIILCFLEIPFVLMKGTHVRSTLIYDKVGPRGKNTIDLIACIIGIIVFVLVIRASWGGFLHTVEINDAEIAGTVRISTIPGRFSIILGSVMMILEYVFLGIKNMIRLKNPSAFDDETKFSQEEQEGGPAV